MPTLAITIAMTTEKLNVYMEGIEFVSMEIPLNENKSKKTWKKVEAPSSGRAGSRRGH